MAGTKIYNTNLDILGSIKALDVPNSTGTFVTWNQSTNIFGTRTNTQLIADLNLATEAWANTNFANKVHTHPISDVIGLQGALNGKANTSGNYQGLSVGNATQWSGQMYNQGAIGNIDVFMTHNGSGWGYTSIPQVQSALGINTSWDLQQVTQNGSSTNVPTFFDANFHFTGAEMFFKNNAGANGIYLEPHSDGGLNFNKHSNYGWTGSLGSIEYANGNFNWNANIVTASFGSADQWNAKLGAGSNISLLNNDIGYITSSALGNYVNKAGDTMTGFLIFEGNEGLGLNNSQWGITYNSNYGGINFVRYYFTDGVFFIKDNENVGVNTINPLYKFDVIGNGRFTGNLIVPNAVASNHAVNLGQILGFNYATETWVLNQISGVSSPYIADGNNIKTTGNGWLTTIGGRYNQALGHDLTLKGSQLNYIGFGSVGSGFMHVTLGSYNVNNGVMSNIIGNYNASNGNLINLFGNYLTSKQEGQSVYGNYNKIETPNVLPSKKKIHVFASGKSEYERDNAVEIFADNSTNHRGRAYYDEQTRDEEWFQIGTTLIDVYYLNSKINGNLQTDANTYNICSNNVLVVGVRKNTQTATDSGFQSINNENCFGVYGIAEGQYNVDVNTGVMYYKDSFYIGASATNALSTVVYKKPYLVVILDSKSLQLDSIQYLNTIDITQNKQSGYIQIVIGSFVNHNTNIYFEFNQQIII